MNNYVNTEKSLKRWLKNRVKITMATVVGFLIVGTVAMGAESIEKINVDKETIINIKTGQNGTAAIVGINANKDNNGKGEDYTTSKNIDITSKENHTDKWVAGILANNGGKVNISGSTINIDLTSENGLDLKGVVARNEGLEDTKATGGKIKLGGENTKDINIKVHGDGFVSALEAHRRNGSLTDTSSIEVKTENLIIEARSDWQGEQDDNGAVYAVFAQGTGGEKDKDAAKIVIDSNNTKITAVAGYNGEGEKYAHSFGLVAFSSSSIEVKGNLEVNADTVIATRGNSSVIVNENNDKTVKLNGDIEFNYDKLSSGTTVESDIILNLSNEDSYLKGKISVTGENIPDDKKDVTGMKLGLSNGGTWEVTGNSFVNDLTMNGGVIEVTENVEKIDVNNLHGNGGVTMFAASVEGDNIEVTGGEITVGNVTGNARLRIGFSGVNADDLVGTGAVAESFKKLQNKVEITIGKDKVEETYFAEEGKVSGEITAKDDGKGGLVITQEKESKTVMGLKDLATINYLSWKQEMGSLTQRMGELRDSSAEHGVWARVYGGKVENGSQYDNEYQTYQVGYDKKYIVDNGRVYFGYLVSYTDGETDYALGHGENYSVGAGIYATWMNNNGHYADVLYKVSRLNNKFDVNSINNQVGKSSGKYDTFGISLSAEYGKRFDLGEKWFAEPSVGMHLGQLGDETYTTNSGIEVSQDSIYTAEGRVGTAIGYKFNDKGNVYARTHVVKEFAGDIDAEYKAEGVTNKTSEDMGDTWLEFGVGVNYRFAENVNVYADVEKTGDSTVDTKWQANLGFRYEF